jgi:hypothetical protein
MPRDFAFHNLDVDHSAFVGCKSNDVSTANRGETNMSSKKGFDTRAVGAVMVDSGHIEMGDCGEVQLTLPTGIGDGIYPVSELSIGGGVVGYFVNVTIEDWTVSELVGPIKHKTRGEHFADPKLAAAWSKARRSAARTKRSAREPTQRLALMTPI